MAAFPALEPSTRTYSLGQFPVTVQAGWHGGAVRFRHGSIASGHTLELGYEMLTAADASLIRAHYREQRSGYVPFSLSSAVWTGHSSTTNLVPATTLWRYSGPPEETHYSGGLIDIQLTLESVI
jgi:hypothetical protein